MPYLLAIVDTKDMVFNYCKNMFLIVVIHKSLVFK